MSTMDKSLNIAIEAARTDWIADVGEHRREAGGGLDRIFKDSGWSSRGCPRDPADGVPDWCGMAVVSWLIKAGLNKGFNTSFLHCKNVEAFFSYGRLSNVNRARLDTDVKLLSGWVPIAGWHDEKGQVREWWSRHGIKREVEAGSPDIFAPGDVMLIDWSGRNEADHITMVRSWDPVTKVLTCFEGNRSGAGPNGEKRVESVVTCTYDLSNTNTLAKIYGSGRLSPLDFGFDAVRPRGKA